ncbi:MAG: LacI family DNA-binding transcriptional regulator [Bacillota bacterium]
MGPTIRDVAKRAQTSVSTVSRVLTRSGPVAEATRQRILAAIEELGYKPNALARGLVSRRTGTIGVVIPDVANPFYAEVLRGMSDVASANGLHMLLVNADLSFDKEAEGFALLHEKQVDGIVYTSGVITQGHREILHRLGRPVVLAATYDAVGGFPAVLVDSKTGATMAMTHLLDLGHRRIAVINGPDEDLIAGSPRWEGYREAAAARGLALDPGLVCTGDYRLESGYRAMERLLARPDPPTAVVAASDLMAIGAINAALDRGVRVPGDLSVVGFDNIWFSAAIRPALTTVAQPMYEIGATAIRMLITAMSGKTEPVVDWIKPYMVERASTAPYR